MTVEYEYATGDLLEDRHTYFYTAYLGEAFLAAWRQSRDLVLHGLPAAAPPPPYDRDARATIAETARTEDLLETAMANLDRAEICPIIDRLIQRFEVTKRIHCAYGPDWRPLDRTAYHDLGLYLRFAELMAAAYTSTARLPPLNALIKSVDTLAAMRDGLTPPQAARLASVIAAERSHVERLQAEMGR